MSLNKGAQLKLEQRQGKNRAIQKAFTSIAAGYSAIADGDDTYPSEMPTETPPCFRHATSSDYNSRDLPKLPSLSDDAKIGLFCATDVWVRHILASTSRKRLTGTDV